MKLCVKVLQFRNLIVISITIVVILQFKNYIQPITISFHRNIVKMQCVYLYMMQVARSGYLLIGTCSSGCWRELHQHRL